MKYSWIIRIVGVLVLLVGIAAVGYFAYTAGLAQGQTAAPVTTGADAIGAGHAPWGYHPVRSLAFFPGLLCLAPFFLCLFIFLPLRMVFGSHRMRMHMHGKWHEGGCGDGIPSPVEEWHRRMHETKKQGE
jgi:hypothetical protein